MKRKNSLSQIILLKIEGCIRPLKDTLSAKFFPAFSKIRDKFQIYFRKDNKKNIYRKVRKFKAFKRSFVRFIKKVSRKLSSSWKTILTVVPIFLFFYYFIGSQIVESIDVTNEYPLSAKKKQFFETPNNMSFLIKREVDGKMWTPNLPIIFPAYVLDNMPNFQKGIIAAVRDITGIMHKLSFNTNPQKKYLKESYKLLSYPSDVWLVTRQKGLKLAPSSNAQYRRASKELQDYRKCGMFTQTSTDLNLFITGISHHLWKIAQNNEEMQRENASNLFDTKSDDLFYYNKGYVFALWQLGRSIGYDYKDVLLEQNIYIDWTYLISSLKKTAELKPWIIRNGKTDSVWTPNHLMTQNYYILRAAVAAEKCTNKLLKGDDVDKR